MSTDPISETFLGALMAYVERAQGAGLVPFDPLTTPHFDLGPPLGVHPPKPVLAEPLPSVSEPMPFVQAVGVAEENHYWFDFGGPA